VYEKIMEITARSKSVRISARKMRLVADAVRGLPVDQALIILQHLRKRAAKPLLLVLKQGMANAANNFGLQKDGLKIKTLEIGEGPTYKRGRPVSRGRWHPILKRTSHIRMILEGKKKETKKKKAVIKKISK